MRQREEIPGIDMPQPVRRIEAADKARQMMQVPKDEPEGSIFKKLTTRIPSEQFEWLSEQPKAYRGRNPARPRVTIEELITIALGHLRDSKDLDAVIAKHRS
jgi:hypothetical protein